MLKMNTNTEKQRELLRLQNTDTKVRANLLLSKKDPLLHPYYHHHRQYPLKTPPKAATTPRTTSLTRTEGFASLAVFDDPLGPSSRRCLRKLQRSGRESRRESAKAKAKAKAKEMVSKCAARRQ
jgi:hypothetical protein